AHELEVGGTVEGAQLIVRGRARLEHAHPLVEAARVELAHEGGETVRAEWMAVAESVARQAFADDHSHAAHVAREAPSRGVSASLTQPRFRRPESHHPPSRPPHP